MKRLKAVIEDVIVQSNKIQPIIGKIDMSHYYHILCTRIIIITLHTSITILSQFSFDYLI